MKLTDYLNAINYSKESLMNTEDEQIEKQYAPYVVNRCLSYFIEVPFVRENDLASGQRMRWGMSLP